MDPEDVQRDLLKRAGELARPLILETAERLGIDLEADDPARIQDPR